ncbi:MAG: class I tRNA ligase family protein, partial [Thermodesulfobacteriota bacterium]
VENGDTVIFPSNWNNLYFDWLSNIRDWCISRQIWWGHRIPAWTCNNCSRITVAREDPEKCPDCGSSELYQDTDVLDTWFSSALWPFSTLGWPEETRELKLFYPTSVLVTAFDIIFFWVARMMMMGLYFMQEVPFRHVYIHALVRDEDGRKMSKSTGNVIDPLLMIERYGADAMRFTLTAFAAMGRDVKLSESRIEGYQHFINKIWNAARLVLLNLDEEVPEFRAEEMNSFSHKYILHELEKVKSRVQEALDGYHFNEAAQALYQFIWHTYCDWYLEMIKPEIYSNHPEERKVAQACLHRTFTEILILLHPFVPFVSQEIWSYFPGIQTLDLSRVMFPESRPECMDDGLEEKADYFQQVVVSVRNIRSELNINPAEKLQLKIKCSSTEKRAFLEENREVITQLARLQDMEIAQDIDAPRASATAVVKGDEIHVPLEGIVDFEAELSRLEKQLKKVDKDFEGLNNKLSNRDFLQKAPAEVVEKEKGKLQELEEKRNKMLSLKQKLQEFV